jgi:hypothetical protein
MSATIDLADEVSLVVMDAVPSEPDRLIVPAAAAELAPIAAPSSATLLLP